MKNVLKHYNATERFLVEKGFARLATDAEKEVDGERIKWKSGQAKRGINADEMSWGLDSQANGLGGRPPMVLMTPMLKSSGYSTQHSSIKMTFFFGMTFGDEPLPPLLILPTSGEFKRLQGELISRFHQVEGRYGHANRKRFSPMIACSPKGSMTGEILQSFMTYCTQLFPDCCDEELHQVFWKLDNAVGRRADEINFVTRTFGHYIYPGLPNTSEGTQEMDQVFFLLQLIMELNRRQIELERTKLGEIF